MADPLEDGIAAMRRGEYATAESIFRSLAEQGNASAQSRLGNMYLEGQGVPKDYAEAFRWLRLAVNHGQDSTNLATMYARGLGIPQDGAEAFKLLRPSAEKGNAIAQFNLGCLYDWGVGVAQDYGEAVKWYHLAADQGHAAAQINLGVSYAKGQGVPQNRAHAYMRFNLAILRASDSEERDLAVNQRAIVVSEMTRDQLNEAQNLEKEWNARRPRSDNFSDIQELFLIYRNLAVGREPTVVYLAVLDFLAYLIARFSSSLEVAETKGVELAQSQLLELVRKAWQLEIENSDLSAENRNQAREEKR